MGWILLIIHALHTQTHWFINEYDCFIWTVLLIDVFSALEVQYTDLFLRLKQAVTQWFVKQGQRMLVSVWSQKNWWSCQCMWGECLHQVLHLLGYMPCMCSLAVALLVPSFNRLIIWTDVKLNLSSFCPSQHCTINDGLKLCGLSMGLEASV